MFSIIGKINYFQTDLVKKFLLHLFNIMENFRESPVTFFFAQHLGSDKMYHRKAEKICYSIIYLIIPPGIEGHPRLVIFHELASLNKLAGVLNASISVVLLT